MRSAVLLLCIVAVVFGAYFDPKKNNSPIWKVFCDNLYGGRLDPIVNPGTYSGHVHRVFGGSHFGQSTATRTPLEQFNIEYSAPCTSCSIKTVDLSNYWTAQLYYKWPNGTFSMVPSGGLTVYYLSRQGTTGTQATDPNWQPIPKGLRMLAGDPTRRTFNASDNAQNAVDYVCLNYNGGGFDESSDWSGLKTHTCPEGLRTQVFFPMCWDGVNLDSTDHKSHMAYPIQNANGGDCPSSHPVRIPGVFFEHIFNVGDFPHGDGTNNFVWSMGDNTGFGHHADFLSGWDPVVMAAAIAHPNCSNDNPLMNFGNSVTACPPLAPYVKDGSEPSCDAITFPVPLTESLGTQQPLARMPGCWGFNATIPGCVKTPAGSDNSGTYYIKSASTGAYLSAVHDGIVYANYTNSAKTYQQVWAFGTGSVAGTVTIVGQEWADVISARDVAQLIGGNLASTWESWTMTYLTSTTVAFKSARTSKYLTVKSDYTLGFSAVNVTATETFVLEANTGGSVPADDGLNALAQVAATSVNNVVTKTVTKTVSVTATATTSVSATTNVNVNGVTATATTTVSATATTTVTASATATATANAADSNNLVSPSHASTIFSGVTIVTVLAVVALML